MLGCGAVLSSLRRMKIGEFNVDRAMQLHDFIERVKDTKTVYAFS